MQSTPENFITLEKISADLQSLIENAEAEIFTFVQTGYDETGLVATSDGYLRFAQGLIDFLIKAQKGELNTCCIGDVEGPADSSIGAISNWRSEVELDSVMLVASEEEVECVLNYFNENPDTVS